MKPTAGNARPRRPAQRPASKPDQTQLNLQRRPRPEPPDRETDAQPRSSFWKWVLIVTLLHAVAISIFYIVQAIMAAEKPAPIMFSLLPPGDTVKGTAGQQAAKKVGLATPAPKHAAAQPPPTAATPPTPKPPPQKTIPPKTELKMDKPTLIQDKPAPKPPVKPPPPKPKDQKVKVDMHLADGPQTDKPKPTKTKQQVKKPSEKKDSDDDSERATNGLSKEEIAAKLGAKSEAEGTHNANKIGTMGAQNGTHNDFSSFYNVIAEQVHDEWNSALTANAEPVVGIHVEPSGRIPVESVHLIRSSGNADYDAAALDTVKRIGMLHEPLPAHCSPDISINFNPNP